MCCLFEINVFNCKSMIKIYIKAINIGIINIIIKKNPLQENSYYDI